MSEPSLSVASPYEPELGGFEAADEGDETVNETGTTTVGIATAEGVAIATDMRASLGGRDADRRRPRLVDRSVALVGRFEAAEFRFVGRRHRQRGLTHRSRPRGWTR